MVDPKTSVSMDRSMKLLGFIPHFKHTVANYRLVQYVQFLALSPEGPSASANWFNAALSPWGPLCVNTTAEDIDWVAYQGLRLYR
mgnify:CR=1 FL=1